MLIYLPPFIELAESCPVTTSHLGGGALPARLPYVLISSIANENLARLDCCRMFWNEILNIRQITTQTLVV